MKKSGRMNGLKEKKLVKMKFVVKSVGKMAKVVVKSLIVVKVFKVVVKKVVLKVVVGKVVKKQR